MTRHDLMQTYLQRLRPGVQGMDDGERHISCQHVRPRPLRGVDVHHRPGHVQHARSWVPGLHGSRQAAHSALEKICRLQVAVIVDKQVDLSIENHAVRQKGSEVASVAGQLIQISQSQQASCGP